MIKGSVQQEDIIIINIYAPNTGAPAYVKQILTVLISDKIDFKTKKVTRDKEGHYIMTKSSV